MSPAKKTPAKKRTTRPRIALGSVYHPPEVPYPRVLVMRRWPRGIRKEAVDHWQRDLGPSDGLRAAYLDHSLTWEEFAEAYREEMGERTDLLAWVADMAATSGVTLLCWSHPDEECHRSILADLIREHLGAA